MTKKDKQMLRMVFEAWREYTVESHASRFRKSLSLEQRGEPISQLSCACIPSLIQSYMQGVRSGVAFCNACLCRLGRLLPDLADLALDKKFMLSCNPVHCDNDRDHMGLILHTSISCACGLVISHQGQYQLADSE